MSVFTGDILCVVDTAYNDQIGNWYAYKLSCTGSIVEQGCIPSHQRSVMGKHTSVANSVCLCLSNCYCVGPLLVKQFFSLVSKQFSHLFQGLSTGLWQAIPYSSNSTANSPFAFI